METQTGALARSHFHFESVSTNILHAFLPPTLRSPTILCVLSFICLTEVLLSFIVVSLTGTLPTPTSDTLSTLEERLKKTVHGNLEIVHVYSIQNPQLHSTSAAAA